MNYSELQAAWRQWSHREDLDDSLLDTIQELVTARLGRDLRTLENEVRQTITVPSDGYNLGSKFMEMRSVKGSQAGREFELTYETPAQFFRTAGLGEATSWTIENGLLKLNTGGGEITIDFYVQPNQLAQPDDENALLTAWPNVYIYAGLVEIFRFLQDAESAGLYGGFYQDELKQTNRQAQDARVGNAAAMRAI